MKATEGTPIDYLRIKIHNLDFRKTDIVSVNLLPKYFKRKVPQSLKAILEECIQSSSERSKSLLYKKFYGYLMAVALRYVKDEMEAEDVVNESFVKIFRKIGDFVFSDDESVIEKTLKGWMARIVVNTSIDKLRLKKNVYVLDDLNDSDLKDQFVHVSTRLEEQDIMKLLDELPLIQKSIFNLFEIEGYSHDEIGKMLNIPESTSRTYLTRAKAKLRQLYKEQFEVFENITHS